MHNTVTASNTTVQFPPFEHKVTNPKYTMNGFLDKNPASLKNGFQAPANKMVVPVDDRMFDKKYSFNAKNTNQVYQPNVQLLSEIEHA